MTSSRNGVRSRSVLQCTKSELDLFSVPPTQTSVEQGNCIEYHPITAVAGDSPIEFDINGSGEDYLDFANCIVLYCIEIFKVA